jgi:hypothetical protein
MDINKPGNIGFAYSAAIVLLEVEDTLREPPKAEVSMKKSVQLGCALTPVLVDLDLSE